MKATIPVGLYPGPMESVGLDVARARYAKGQASVRLLRPHPTGWAGRGERLCRAVGGRFSNRERAYIMSASKARRLVELWALCADAHPLTYAIEWCAVGLDEFARFRPEAPPCQP